MPDHDVLWISAYLVTFHVKFRNKNDCYCAGVYYFLTKIGLKKVI